MADNKTVFGKTEFTAEEQESIQDALRKKLGPSFISKRVGPGGQKIAYIEGWRVVSLANEIFGFNGWSHTVTNQTIDFVDHYNSRYYVGVSATVKVALKDGVFHEDVGYGVSEGMRSKALSLEKARKESVTDGLKRSLKSFGNAMGSCLSNKEYTQFINRIPCPKAVPINPSELLEQDVQSNLAKIRRNALQNGKKPKQISNSTAPRIIADIPVVSRPAIASHDLAIKIPTPPPSLLEGEPFQILDNNASKPSKNKEAIRNSIEEVAPPLNDQNKLDERMDPTDNSTTTLLKINEESIPTSAQDLATNSSSSPTSSSGSSSTDEAATRRSDIDLAVQNEENQSKCLEPRCKSPSFLGFGMSSLQMGTEKEAARKERKRKQKEPFF